jgi:PAS domain S-box-containing protein
VTFRNLSTALVMALALIVLPPAAVIGLQLHQILDRAPRLTQSRERVVHTFEVITAAQALEQSVRDAERGVRRFTFSGERFYLETYQAAVPRARALMAQLKTLTADNPEQSRRLPALERQLDVALRDFSNTLDKSEQNGFAAVQDLLRANANFDAVTAIGELVDATIATERALLGERLARTGEEERKTEQIAVTSAILAFSTMALGAVLALIAFRNARRTEAARLAGEQRLALLVDGVADHALYVLDSEGRITDWNKGAQRLKGYQPGEIIGEHFSRFYTDEDREAGLPQRALAAAEQNGKYQAEGWRVRKDGSRFFASVVISPLRDPFGRLIGFGKITRDMTAQKEQQQELEQARAALAQAQKMEALGQLTGGIAHDFNNLLHVMRNSVEIVMRRLPDPDPAIRRYLDMIKRNADRAASVTHRLLAFARRQPLDPKPLDLNRIVSGTGDLLRNALGERIAIEVVQGSGIWPIAVDANHLETAMLNLALNARDAMPEGGKLTIETSNAFLDEAYAAAHAEVQPGQYVMIAISDTGSGMTKQTIARAFEPFFTTKEPGLGTGLGLSQVFGFVKQSGGHVKIYSEVGQGTTVKLYLPRLVAAGAAVAREPEPVLARTATETILVVEDDDDVRSFTADVLGELGYQVTVASDGPVALSVLEKLARVDLLLTDVGLPNGMNGRQLADEVRRRRPEIRVLYTTGYARNAIVHHGRLDPGVELIVKPFSQSSLAAKIRHVLDSNTGAQEAAK